MSSCLAFRNSFSSLGSTDPLVAKAIRSNKAGAAVTPPLAKPGLAGNGLFSYFPLVVCWGPENFSNELPTFLVREAEGLKFDHFSG